MIGINDNVATGLMLERITADLRLVHTAVPVDCRELLKTIGENLGIEYDDDERALGWVSGYTNAFAARPLSPEEEAGVRAATERALARAVPLSGPPSADYAPV